MPTYDYKCKECGHLFEEFQSMSSDFLVTCPSCGKPGLVRLMAGGAGLVFKGSGFYLTDYKKAGSSTSSSNSKSEPSSKSESSSSDKSSDSSTDSGKSDSKPSTPPAAPPKPDQK
ncbi:MAG: zinc ribbon domain-containing protein [Ignavibacteriales bacterium]|nr:zinc ribbon domain-containing protein [Ignavibacteriales bacterium]